MANFNDGRYGSFKAAKEIGISLERLRYWEKVGIANPRYIRCGTRKFRRYTYIDIRRAISVKWLVDEEKYTLEGAIRKLEKEMGG